MAAVRSVRLRYALNGTDIVQGAPDLQGVHAETGG